MSQVSIPLHETPLTVNDDQFAVIVAENPDLRFELTANGELIVNPPTGGKSSQRNLSISAQLWNWAEVNQSLGVAFESSGGFRLPNGATRSPDACWVKRNRWDALNPEQQLGFVPLCPDFVVELRSASDRLDVLQQKMQEYITNGALLGWLIDPQSKNVEIYRPGQSVQVLEQPETLSGEDVLPGFILQMKRILG
jgi:Uma2 family endonuclease